MYHFFVDYKLKTGDQALISGPDCNHIKNVLRMKPGEEIILTDHGGDSFLCKLVDLSGPEIVAIACSGSKNTELSCKITLYQGLPKADKLETIIQKAVELGADKIVPVEMKRSVVKLDEKKKSSKLLRWQAISESAAKQSKRSIVPQIGEVIDYKTAILDAKDSVIIVPYESENGMQSLRQVLEKVESGAKFSIFIGPEGGFEDSEVELAKENGANVVSLGRRILRTETAGPAILSMLMLTSELKDEQE